MRRWRRIFRNPFRPDEPWSAVEEEFDFHLQAKVDDLVAAGWSRDEARREAERRFGDRRRWVRRTADERRRTRRAAARQEWADAVLDDLRTSLRRLHRAPLTTLAAVAVLATGLAVSTPVLTVLDHVLLRPAPFPEPDRVAWLTVTGAEGRFVGRPFQASGGAYLDWKARQEVFDVLAATQWSEVAVGDERPDRVRALRVEPDFFQVTGIDPRLGRAILSRGAADPREAVLSDALWRTRFDADPGVLGRTIQVDGALWEVVGVMPAGFRFWDMGGGETIPALLLSNPFVGWGGDPTFYTPAGRIQPVGRLPEGMTSVGAEERLEVMVRSLMDERPDVYREGMAGSPMALDVSPYLDRVRQPIRRSLYFVGGATLLLLAVIVATVAGILATAAGDRVRELTLRSALGASRARIVRQVLLESGMLVTVAGVVGGLTAYLALPRIKAAVPGSVPRLEDAAFDPRIVTMVILSLVLVWLLSSLPAIRRATRIDLRSVLAGGGRGTTLRGRLHWLLGLQLAVTTALLATAGVLLENQRRTATLDPGFDPQGLQALQFRAPEARYAELIEPEAPHDGSETDFEEGVRRLRVDMPFRELVRRGKARLAAVPGVDAVSFVNNPPAWGPYLWGTGLADVEEGSFIQKWVDPGYADVVRLRLARGRWIEPSDVRGGASVVVVNRSFADRYMPPDQDPVGHVVTFNQGVAAGDQATTATVVGVVEDLVQDPREPGYPVLYQPLEQRITVWPDMQDAYAREVSFIVRASGEVDARALREAIWSVDPGIPIDTHVDLSSALASHLAQQRFFLLLMAGFGAATLLMAAAGTGALVARRVRRARKEIGVRRALGATGPVAGAQVLRDVALATLGGSLVGLASSFWVDGLLGSYLIGFSSDPVAVRMLTTATVVLAGVAAAARPARAASRVDPVEVLRAE